MISDQLKRITQQMSLFLQTNYRHTQIFNKQDIIALSYIAKHTNTA